MLQGSGVAIYFLEKNSSDKSTSHAQGALHEIKKLHIPKEAVEWQPTEWLLTTNVIED